MHRGPGEINYPIACGGVVVNPGDVIVGDLNGVVVVPRGVRGRRCSQRLREREAAESDYNDAVARGELLERLGRRDPRGQRRHRQRHRPLDEHHE